MENKLRGALNKIHAEDDLKEKTAALLRGEIRKSSHTPSRRSTARFAAVCASFALLLFAGGLSYQLYFTPAVFIDMDVNPSVGLTLNRFGRVLEADPYNDDGTGILQSVDVRNKTYERAIQALLDEMIRQDYLKSDGLVSVTLQAGEGGAEQKMLEEVRVLVDQSLASHHSPAASDVFAVSRETRNCAYEYGLSPAKYLAITKLQEVDSTATFESCAGHSISEIRQLTEEHGGGMRHRNGRGHHGGEHE